MENQMINLDYLKTETEFYIRTTQNEHFKITPLDQGYRIIEMNPPEHNFVAKDVFSAKRRGGNKVNLAVGIDPGAMLAWEENQKEVIILSKGAIKECYFIVDAVQYQFEEHLILPKGKRLDLSEVETSFVVQTETGEYPFSKTEKGWEFEGEKVLAFYSLIQEKKPVDFAMLLMNNKRNIPVVEHSLYYYRPFMIVKEDEKEIRFSYINELVKKIQIES